MFQNLPNLYEQVNCGLYYGNLDFNFNVDAEKTLLNLDQRYLNVHYRLNHVKLADFNRVCMSSTPGHDKTLTRFWGI